MAAGVPWSRARRAVISRRPAGLQTRPCFHQATRCGGSRAALALPEETRVCRCQLPAAGSPRTSSRSPATSIGCCRVRRCPSPAGRAASGAQRRPQRAADGGARTWPRTVAYTSSSSARSSPGTRCGGATSSSPTSCCAGTRRFACSSSSRRPTRSSTCRTGACPPLPGLRSISADGRLRAFRPLKPLPRRGGAARRRAPPRPGAASAAGSSASRDPPLVNDVTYAPLIASHGLAVPLRRHRRLAPRAVRGARARAPARGSTRWRCTMRTRSSSARRPSRRAAARARTVTLIPNGVDVEHFRRPRPGPPTYRTHRLAVYVGTLHEPGSTSSSSSSSRARFRS